MGGDGVARWPDRANTEKLTPAFPMNTDNPVARATAVRQLKAHNDLIHKTGFCVDTREEHHVKQYRKYRQSNPNFGMWGLDSIQAKMAKDQDDDVMGQAISKAQNRVDTSTPEVAWAFREHADMLRAHTLANPSYKESQGYEIQWSVQEAAHARRNLHTMERAKQAGGYLKGHGMITEGKKTKQFRKWRAAQREWRMEKAAIEVEPPLEPRAASSNFPPSIAFPGPRNCSGVETPDLGKVPPLEALRQAKSDKKLHNMHYEMGTRIQVTGKIRAKVKERYEDEEEEKAAQAQGLAPGTVHQSFGKHAGKSLPDELQMVNPSSAAPIDGIPATDPAVDAHSNAARDFLLEQLTCKSQQMAMQSASNDRVRALLVKQNKVKESMARNKRKSRNKEQSSRPVTQMSQQSRKTLPETHSRAASTQPSSRRKPSKRENRALAQQNELRKKIEHEMAQLNHNVQRAVNAGRQVAQSTIHATKSMMQARPEPAVVQEYMYKAKVLKDWDSGDGAQLRVAKGDMVFVFEDDESGCFECMDQQGTVGRLPQNLLQFEEQVPRLRPIDLIGAAAS